MESLAGMLDFKLWVFLILCMVNVVWDEVQKGCFLLKHQRFSSKRNREFVFKQVPVGWLLLWGFFVLPF